MDTNNQINKQRAYHQAVAMVDKFMPAFARYMSQCLDNEGFEEDMYQLNTYDGNLRASLSLEGKSTLIKSMGIIVIRIEKDPPLFCLGVSIELSQGEYNKGGSLVTFISACLSHDGLLSFVQSASCADNAQHQFKDYVKTCFYP